ncbi:tetratricopeptide repeat-containing protein [Massilia sp. IC2-476]|uniref:tetratricopeptide repeat-containing protein n=1 Tax=Massilia sp. IC2-476 TaxID=2887199 RepID=UPI001D11D0E0|nr:tetratricopeptide repeat-containing protein [Massilia sp. IC2-476]MCC2970468.1 tetratricopeptide repeat-containing protein [Massilia sp. IC2-476]
MDENLTMLPALDSPGKVTTFYAYEGGPARNALLAALALQLAADPAGAPVLVIDWDLESPALHHYLEQPPGPDDAAADPPGLAEYVAALREELRRCRGGMRAAASDLPAADLLADMVLDAVDWRAHLRRVDGRRPLYLMRAGRFDEGYAERAAGIDWVALFDACPALLRRFAARMGRHFLHVLVASRAGRSAAVSACTTLVPDRLVGLFTPAPGSLEGFEGVVRRATEYRCTHEDEQRPLLVYPVACAADGARSDPGQRWRRGDAAQGMDGYQGRIEALLRDTYGVRLLHLDSWFDEVQLPLCDAAAIAGPGALARPATCLLSWFARGHFPWHSPPEFRLRTAIALARIQEGRGAAVALAGHLARLAALCRNEGRDIEASELLGECLALRRLALGEDHSDTRAALRLLAALHLAGGQLDDARHEYEQLAQACARSAGAEHPDTLAARSGLASVLGRLHEGERALALHEQVVATCERLWGDAHPATLDSVEALAATLSEQHENERARVLFDRVLDGRRRLQGNEHEDTLRCAQRLAQLLGEMGELGNARRLLEGVLRARERYDGAFALPTLRAREALAEILAAQGDMAAVRSIQAAPARVREPELDAGHPAFDSLQHQFAQLQDLIDRESRHEARALADKLHHSVQWRTVAHPLRKRAAAMIEQVYLQEGDKDAALAFNRNLVSSLEGALFQSGHDGPPMLR